MLSALLELLLVLSALFEFLLVLSALFEFLLVVSAWLELLFVLSTLSALQENGNCPLFLSNGNHNHSLSL